MYRGVRFRVLGFRWVEGVLGGGLEVCAAGQPAPPQSFNPKPAP